MIWFVSYFGYSSIVPLSPTKLLSFFGGDETILLHDLESETSEVFGTVPALFRRGVEHPCAHRGIPEWEGCAAPVDLFTSMWGAWELEDGRIVIAHVDTSEAGTRGPR